MQKIKGVFMEKLEEEFLNSTISLSLLQPYVQTKSNNNNENNISNFSITVINSSDQNTIATKWNKNVFFCLLIQSIAVMKLELRMPHCTSKSTLRASPKRRNCCEISFCFSWVISISPRLRTMRASTCCAPHSLGEYSQIMSRWVFHFISFRLARCFPVSVGLLVISYRFVSFRFVEFSYFLQLSIATLKLFHQLIDLNNQQIMNNLVLRTFAPRYHLLPG